MAFYTLIARAKLFYQTLSIRPVLCTFLFCLAVVWRARGNVYSRRFCWLWSKRRSCFRNVNGQTTWAGVACWSRATIQTMAIKARSRVLAPEYLSLNFFRCRHVDEGYDGHCLRLSGWVKARMAELPLYTRLLMIRGLKRLRTRAGRSLHHSPVILGHGTFRSPHSLQQFKLYLLWLAQLIMLHFREKTKDTMISPSYERAKISDQWKERKFKRPIRNASVIFTHRRHPLQWTRHWPVV